jgi:hypothetical protein
MLSSTLQGCRPAGSGRGAGPACVEILGSCVISEEPLRRAGVSTYGDWPGLPGV